MEGVLLLSDLQELKTEIKEDMNRLEQNINSSISTLWKAHNESMKENNKAINKLVDMVQALHLLIAEDYIKKDEVSNCKNSFKETVDKLEINIKDEIKEVDNKIEDHIHNDRIMRQEEFKNKLQLISISIAGTGLFLTFIWKVFGI